MKLKILLGQILAKGVDYLGQYNKFQRPYGQRHQKTVRGLYGELGMNLTTAINVFLRQSLRAGGFPFDVTLGTPNAATVAAMKESERIARDPTQNVTAM